MPPHRSAGIAANVELLRVLATGGLAWVLSSVCNEHSRQSKGSDVQVLIGQLFNGISVGSILLLAAIGLALTFGQMGVINMAHGEFIMAGGYTAWVVQGWFSNAGVGLLISIPVAFLIAGLLGVILEMTLLRRMYHRPLDTLLVTWGVSLALQQLAKDIFGTQGKSMNPVTWLTGPLEVFGVNLPKTRIFVLILATVAVIGLSIGLKTTPLGRRIRATVQNRQLAECSGISSRATDRLTFFLGSGLAGMAGVALTQIGQIKGAVIAAFVLGLGQAAVEYMTNSSIARIIIFLAIVAFLQLRPQGIFNVRTRSLA